MKARLVKWDASACVEVKNPWWKAAIRRLAKMVGRDVFAPAVITPDLANAADHPGCIEIIEMNEGVTPQTVYRRDPCL